MGSAAREQLLSPEPPSWLRFHLSGSIDLFTPGGLRAGEASGRRDGYRKVVLSAKQVFVIPNTPGGGARPRETTLHRREAALRITRRGRVQEQQRVLPTDPAPTGFIHPSHIDDVTVANGRRGCSWAIERQKRIPSREEEWAGLFASNQSMSARLAN